MKHILRTGTRNLRSTIGNVQSTLGNFRTTLDIVWSSPKTLITMSHAFDSEKVGRYIICEDHIILNLLGLDKFCRQNFKQNSLLLAASISAGKIPHL